MAYVNVPKDLTKVKSKVLFHLTRRQIICFGIAALIGIPLFFLLKGPIGSSPAAMVMILIMLPAFLLAMYEKNGQPLEKILWNMIQVCLIRPKQRPYKTNNFYAVLERQQILDKEVYEIVHGKKASRAKAGGGSHRPGQKTGQGKTLRPGQHPLPANGPGRDLPDH